MVGSCSAICRHGGTACERVTRAAVAASFCVSLLTAFRCAFRERHATSSHLLECMSVSTCYFAEVNATLATAVVVWFLSGFAASQVRLEDMDYVEELETYYYPCPCGDRFQITLDELIDGEEIGRCPSCSLVIHVLYDALP